MSSSSLPLRSRPLSLILLLAALARIGIFVLQADLRGDFYFEYGEIAKNVAAGKGYSLFHFEDGRLDFHFSETARTLPSAFMPPGYVMFLLPFIAVGDPLLRNILLFAVQAAISMFAIVLTHRYTSRHCGSRAAFWAACCAAFLPDFIYAPASWTPTVLFQLLFLLFLELSDRSAGLSTRAVVAGVAVLSAAMVYLRSEWLLYVLLLAGVRLLSGGWKRTVAGAAVCVCLLVPWGFRNYAVFEELVPLSTNGGLNLFRGENPGEIGKWNNELILESIPSLPRDASFEPAFDRAYREEALRWMAENPGAAARRVPRKLIDLWVFNAVQERPFQFVPAACGVLLFLFFLLGAVKARSWGAFQPVWLLLIQATVVGVVFFTLPRHQTMMRIGMLPFAGVGLAAVAEMVRRLRESRRNRRG